MKKHPANIRVSVLNSQNVLNQMQHDVLGGRPEKGKSGRSGNSVPALIHVQNTRQRLGVSYAREEWIIRHGQ